MKYNKRGKTRSKKLALAIVAVLAVFVVAGVVSARNYYKHNLSPVSNSQVAVTVSIPTGSTLHDISTLLQQKGLIRNSRVFEQYARGKGVGDKLQAGTYSLLPSQSSIEIIDILTQGHILKNLFTILPGQRIDQIKSAMINAGFEVKEVEAAFNPDLYVNHPALSDKPAGASLEGYLYPESFQKTSATTPHIIISQSLDQMQKHLTPSLREAFVGQGLTVHQGVTLASIVEQEVSNNSDRGQAAQVFLKRLHQDIMLGSDVTAFYGSIIAGRNPSVTYDSSYNTHLYKGLTPGPISNVSESSLQAVAHPANTGWLFFVSGDDGKTYFSNTLEEHQALTREHCKKLCEL